MFSLTITVTNSKNLITDDIPSLLSAHYLSIKLFFMLSFIQSEALFICTVAIKLFEKHMKFSSNIIPSLEIWVNQTCMTDFVLFVKIKISYWLCIHVLEKYWKGPPTLVLYASKNKIGTTRCTDLMIFKQKWVHKDPKNREAKIGLEYCDETFILYVFFSIYSKKIFYCM